MPGEPDPVLRRIERRSILVCLAMAILALAASRGDLRAAFGVLGGGLLIFISYRTIGTGVTGVVDLFARTGAGGEGAPAPVKPGRTVMVVSARYALLALLAYVMIARLRLHPIGLLAGASSVVAAAALEALRQITKKS